LRGAKAGQSGGSEAQVAAARNAFSVARAGSAVDLDHGFVAPRAGAG
jgi:hypothetical protein